MTVRLTHDNQKAILTIQGRFDFNVHTAFRQCSEEALKNDATRQVVVNLTRVNYLDSSALGMLLLLREKAAAAGRPEVTLCGATGIAQQVLDVANFGRMFRIE